MSFSREVKAEISENISKSRHCRIAEISALFSVYGRVVSTKSGKIVLQFSTDNLTVAIKYYILVKKVFDFSLEASLRNLRRGTQASQYRIYLIDEREVRTFLKALKMMDEGGQWVWGNSLVSELLVQQTCCKRAFIRGMFLAAGSITDPDRGYHFEVVCNNLKRAQALCEIIKAFGIDAKIVERKKNYIVYLKEGSQIVDILNVMEAHVALMKFENIRILKEVRNSINRQVNCETANIKKTVSAATKQVDDIRFIEEKMGLGMLPEGLAQIAKLRIQYSEVSLKELGEMLNPPIGKSGVNHRLRKLGKIAEELRGHKEEEL